MATACSSHMASAIVFVLVVFCCVKSGVSEEIHTVGDNSGWTVGTVNYTSWAASLIFHVGDILLFKYNNQFHNVLKVTKSAYHSCNATEPLATYTTGNDSVVINKRGHLFFICGFPGHCQGGQKVDIRVPKAESIAPSSSPSSTPSPASSSSQTESPATPAPNKVDLGRKPMTFMAFWALVFMEVALVL
ncbi:hypothetical protein AMTRI_Chr03g45770 [Amborella trichopoda]|nr:mavicyanin [Amborella trichopoda]|eukprot:XP_011621416.1 mavicyanin [Amborella trichopoda]